MRLRAGRHQHMQGHSVPADLLGQRIGHIPGYRHIQSFFDRDGSRRNGNGFIPAQPPYAKYDKRQHNCTGKQPFIHISPFGCIVCILSFSQGKNFAAARHVHKTEGGKTIVLSALVFNGNKFSVFICIPVSPVCIYAGLWAAGPQTRRLLYAPTRRKPADFSQKAALCPDWIP